MPTAMKPRPRTPKETLPTIEAIPFFDRLKVKETKLEAFCPYCNKMCPARQKLYLMVCDSCGNRLD